MSSAASVLYIDASYRVIGGCVDNRFGTDRDFKDLRSHTISTPPWRLFPLAPVAPDSDLMRSAARLNRDAYDAIIDEAPLREIRVVGNVPWAVDIDHALTVAHAGPKTRSNNAEWDQGAAIPVPGDGWRGRGGTVFSR